MDVREDDTLLMRLRAGDMDALRELFDVYYLPLCCYAVQWVDDDREAQDIVQDIFVSLWEKRHFANIMNIKRYLYVSVRNASVAAVRRRMDTAALSEIEADLEPGAEMPLFTLEELNEREAMLRERLKELSPREYEVLMAVVVNNRKYREAAAEMGVTENTIKMLLKRAMRKLRRNNLILVLVA